MEKALKILLLEDNSSDAGLIERLLKKSELNFEFRHAVNKKAFLLALDEFNPDIILSDNSLPNYNATEAVKLVRQRSMHIPFILITGTVSEEFAATIIKLGADDYILKDRMARLPAAIDAAIKQRRLEKEKGEVQKAIIESEEKYRTLIDQAFDGIIVYSIQGAILDCNHAACDYIGYTRKELKKLTVRELFFDEDLRVKPLYFETLKTGHPTFDYRRLRRRDGAYLEMEISTKMMPDGNLMAIARDITEKKKAEEALQVAYGRLSFHIENAPLGFIEWDELFHVKSWSKRAEEIFGWSEKEFISLQKSGFSQVYNEDIHWVSKIAGQLLSGQIERNSLQHRNYTKDGKVIWCEWFNSVLKDKNDKVITILSLVQDITAKKKIEQDLLNTRMRLEQAQEIAHLGNWFLDFETNTSHWSDEAYRIYGIVPGDHNISQEDWMSFIHPDDLVLTREHLSHLQQTLSNTSFQHRIIRKDGAVRYIQSDAKFELNSKGKPTGLYGVALDITEIKIAEEERKKLEHLLFEQQRKEQLKITATALEAQEIERTAIGQELHDNVNQILAATKMNLKMGSGTSPGINSIIATSIEYIDQAIKENRKIAHALVTPDLAMGSLVEELKGLVKSMLGKAGIKTQFFTRTFREKLLDKNQLIAVYRIAQEQCTNIIKYAEAVTVVITLSTSGSSFRMTISDDGKGMEAGKKIEGIGLRNINSRLSVYNGSAQIDTAPRKGFTLEIEMPLKNDV
jgi:PAS domain S-box-containing protein